MLSSTKSVAANMRALFVLFSIISLAFCHEVLDENEASQETSLRQPREAQFGYGASPFGQGYYGAPRPFYGQPPPPFYGQPPPPFYGQPPAPFYGQPPAPFYGAPRPGFPGFTSPFPGYPAPSPFAPPLSPYGPPPPIYGAPNPAFGFPPPGLGAPYGSTFSAYGGLPATSFSPYGPSGFGPRPFYGQPRYW